MKVSVIVPIYNAVETLGKCITSIARQSYEDLEIILINDGSTDQSDRMCREYSERDNRIVYIEQENKGVDATRKIGISVASGDYITFVDADDYLEPDIYETIINGMSEDVVDIIAYDIVEESESSTKIICNNVLEGVYSESEMKRNIYPKMLSASPFFSFGILPSMYSKMIRTDFLRGIDIHTDERIAFGEDAAFVFQTLAFAKSLQVMKCAGYYYTRSIRDSLTWKPQNEEIICALQESMAAGFRRAGVQDIMQPQLQEYITFIRLLKAPQTVDKVSDYFNTDRRIGLYGAGGFGQAIFHEYGARVTLWVDRDYERYSFLDGKVSSIEDLVCKSDKYDVIYIAIINERLCKQIKKELLKKGIEKEIRYFCIKDR